MSNPIQAKNRQIWDVLANSQPEVASPPEPGLAELCASNDVSALSASPENLSVYLQQADKLAGDFAGIPLARLLRHSAIREQAEVTCAGLHEDETASQAGAAAVGSGAFSLLSLVASYSPYGVPRYMKLGGYAGAVAGVLGIVGSILYFRNKKQEIATAREFCVAEQVALETKQDEALERLAQVCASQVSEVEQLPEDLGSVVAQTF